MKRVWIKTLKIMENICVFLCFLFFIGGYALEFIGLSHLESFLLKIGISNSFLFYNIIGFSTIAFVFLISFVLQKIDKK